MKTIKELVCSIPEHLPIFSPGIPFKGYNESTQYRGTFNYRSHFPSSQGCILIEISLREQHFEPYDRAYAKTFLQNGMTYQPLVPPYPVQCYNKKEAYAEKVRAALTRRRMAIRDFYDLHYALSRNIVSLFDNSFVELVQKKLHVSKSTIVKFDSSAIKKLTANIETELNPTLQKNDFSQEQLMTVIETLNQIKEKLA